MSQAQNPDELSIVESEQLEVVGEGDGDGWLRARNYRGEEGFVPQNYLDVEREPEITSGLSSQGPGLVQQISFSSVDYTIDDHDAVDPDANLQPTVPETIVQNHIGGKLTVLFIYLAFAVFEHSKMSCRNLDIFFNQLHGIYSLRATKIQDLRVLFNVERTRFSNGRFLLAFAGQE